MRRKHDGLGRPHLTRLEPNDRKRHLTALTTEATETPAGPGRVGAATLWSVLGNGTAQAMSLLLFLVIARFVSQESFGIMAVGLSVIEILRRVAIDPVAMAVNAKPVVTAHDFDICFTMTLATSLGLAFLLLIGGIPLSHLIGSPQAGEFLPVLAIIMVGMGITRTHDVWLARHMRFRAAATRTVLSVIAGGLVGVTMAVNGYEIWSLVGQQITITAVGAIIHWLTTPWRPRLSCSWQAMKENLAQSRHISIASLWHALSQDADIFFVSGTLGPAAAGLFSAAKRIILAATLMLSHSLNSVSVSVLANIENVDERRGAALQSLSLTSLAMAPAFAGLAAVSPQLIEILLGPEWAGTAPILAALSLSGYAMALHLCCSAILMVAQRARIDTICSALAAITGLGVLWAVNAHGVIAVAAAVSAIALLSLPLRLEFARRAMRLTWSALLIALLPSTIAAAAMATALIACSPWLAGLPSGIALILLMAGGASLYALLIRLLARRQFDLIAGTIIHMVRA